MSTPDKIALTRAEAEEGNGKLVREGGQALMRLGGGASRNFIINGSMQVHHRGTKFNLTGSGYTIDRWFLGKSAAAPTVVAERVLDVPPSSGVVASLRAKILGVITPKQDDYYCIQQLLEGVDIAPLQGNTIYISFWVKSSVAGTYSASLYGGLTEHSFVTEYKIDKPNQWKKVTLVIDGGFPLNQPLQLGDECGMKLSFSLGCGSNYQTDKLESWVKGAFHSSKNQVNLLTKKDAEFQLAAVTLTIGGFPLSATERSYSAELALCQRYFLSVRPYDLLGTSMITSTYITDKAGGDPSPVVTKYPGRSLFSIPTPVSMRNKKPSVNFYNGGLVHVLTGLFDEAIKDPVQLKFPLKGIQVTESGINLEFLTIRAHVSLVGGSFPRWLEITAQSDPTQPSGFDAELYP